jgi:hypothetical protein
MSAIRPMEASKAVVCYVRFTSIRDVAQTSQMRKERPFADGVAEGRNPREVAPQCAFNAGLTP